MPKHEVVSMKSAILILTSLLFLTGVSEGKEVSEVTYLQDRNGIKFQINSQTPFTGRFVKSYDNGQRMIEWNYKNGKKEGYWTIWFENGEKKSVKNYKNGELDGLNSLWFKRGQKRVERYYKNGNKYGLWTYWDKKGNVTKTETYKNGKLIK